MRPVKPVIYNKIPRPDPVLLARMAGAFERLRAAAEQLKGASLDERSRLERGKARVAGPR